MKKTNRVKLISTILSLSCVGVLLAFAATSFAWFSVNKTVKTSGMKVKCYLDQSVGLLNNEYSVYGYNIENDEPEKMTSLALGDYDAFIQKNNSYARRFVRAQLYYPNSVKSGQKLRVKIECEPNHLFKTVSGSQGQNQFIDKYISNLIEFKFLDNFEKSIDIENADSSNIDTIYNQCVEKFDGKNDGITFVNKSNIPTQETDKTTLIEYVVDLPSAAYGETGYTTDFFIEYSYNDTLVEYYRAKCEDEYNLDIFVGSNLIEFEKDIISMSFALTGGN